MRSGNALNNNQKREILRTKIGSKTQEFGIQAICCMFTTYMMVESKRFPRVLESFAQKMDTSVAILNNNYMWIDNDEMNHEEDGYHGI